MGRPPEELVGHRAVDHIHPDDRAAIAAAMADLAANGAEAATLVYRVLRPDQPPGTETWVEGTARAIRDPASGALDGYVVVTRDVTERLRLERERAAEQGELALARDAAEAASRAKSRFLSSMSHELRTPLNVILGFAQVLSLDPGLRGTQRDQVDAMQSAGRHLLDMISGILDFSRIEAGQLDLNPSITPLRPLLAECLEMVSQAAGAKQLRLTLDVAPDAPLAARLDPLRLRQILLNLLDNAVKFTPAGSVSLRLLAVGQDQLRLEVADTGHGIAASQRSRLFKDFERLSRGDATVKGSGLGLAISARLAALMGGRLDHADNPGGGSLFWLELPLQPPPG
jgi:PAS domain S-box-containing protein